MKLQYLGDSKDSFKWDYHHFLVEALGYSRLRIAWMMNDDDGGPDGRTAPELFPARPEILRLCNQLRATRNPALVSDMPAAMGASYAVNFHESTERLPGDTAHSFFSGIETGEDQVIFLDPDKGFEPERSSSDGHVRYRDLDGLLGSIAPRSVVTVFQHHRRKKFSEDFTRIRERLLRGHACAVYWQSLMFVCVSTSIDLIDRINEINRQYAQQRPVNVLV